MVPTSLLASLHSEPFLQDLAGNAFTVSVFAALMCAFLRNATWKNRTADQKKATPSSEMISQALAAYKEANG
jgi:hypothetical protein